jgi:hypothetical protein
VERDGRARPHNREIQILRASVNVTKTEIMLGGLSTFPMFFYIYGGGGQSQQPPNPSQDEISAAVPSTQLTNSIASHTLSTSRATRPRPASIAHRSVEKPGEIKSPFNSPKRSPDPKSRRSAAASAYTHCRAPLSLLLLSSFSLSLRPPTPAPRSSLAFLFTPAPHTKLTKKHTHKGDQYWSWEKLRRFSCRWLTGRLVAYIAS